MTEKLHSLLAPHERVMKLSGIDYKEIDLMLKFADMAGYQRHKKMLELIKND